MLLTRLTGVLGRMEGHCEKERSANGEIHRTQHERVCMWEDGWMRRRMDGDLGVTRVENEDQGTERHKTVGLAGWWFVIVEVEEIGGEVTCTAASWSHAAQLSFSLVHTRFLQAHC